MRYHVIPPGRREARYIVLPAEMQRADAFTIETLGLPGLALMENAGRHVAVAVAERAAPGARIGVVCGGGNNGGDGFVAARHLRAWGYEVDVVLCCTPDRLRGDAAVNYAVLRSTNARLLDAGDLGAIGALPRPGRYAVLVDALLGTGLSGEVRGAVAEAIAWINGHGAQVVAVDVPSGLSAATGQPLGDAVRADATVTFAASKVGHWLYPGPTYVGDLRVVDIGLPDGVVGAESECARWILGDEDLAPALEPRQPDTHKGTFGHLYVLGGSVGKTGAVRMALDAALRAGAGLVTLGTTEAALPLVSGALYEAMSECALREAEPPRVAAERLAARLDSRSAVAIGPGFDTAPVYGDLLAELLPRVEVPAVVDADGLNHLAGRWSAFRDGGPRVLTPHPGEAARLLACSTAEVQADRLGAAQRIAELSGAVTVLKGAHTVVCAPDGALGICPDGNPGMASGGMGDVLTGIIGALLARGLDAQVAASAGVLWHARAADLAARRRGEAGLLARDVVEALGEVEVASC